MRSPTRIARCGLAFLIFISVATATAHAEGIVVRGETLLLGAAPATVSLEDGRSIDLSRLIRSTELRPPFRVNDLVVFDLSMRETRLGDDSTGNRSLIAELGGASTLLGAILDEPGDILYYESSPTGPDDLAHAERFLLVDAFDGARRFVSNPGIPVPEPAANTLLSSGAVGLLMGLSRRHRLRQAARRAHVCETDSDRG